MFSNKGRHAGTEFREEASQRKTSLCKNEVFASNRHTTKLGPNAVQELKINQRRILIDSLEIGIPAPEQMIALGERQLPNGVKVGQLLNSKTLNYKKFTPHRDGLFCERIFGPVQSFVCACGKKKESVQSKSRQKDIVKTKLLPPSVEVGEAEMISSFQKEPLFCPKCQVEYISKNVRRHRLGYIKLFAPVTHIWYLKGRPSYLSLFLGKRKKAITSLAYCNAYLVEQVYSNLEAKNIIKDTDKSVSPLIENNNIKIWQNLNLKKRGRKNEEGQIIKDKENSFSLGLAKTKFGYPAGLLLESKGGEIVNVDLKTVKIVPEVSVLPSLSGINKYSQPNIRFNSNITNTNNLYKTQKDVTNRIGLTNSGVKPFLSLLEQLFDRTAVMQKRSYAKTSLCLPIPIALPKRSFGITKFFSRSFGIATGNTSNRLHSVAILQNLQRCNQIFNKKFVLSPATLSLNKKHAESIRPYLLINQYKSVTKPGSWLELLPKWSLGIHKMNDKARGHIVPAPIVNRRSGQESGYQSKKLNENKTSFCSTLLPIQTNHPAKTSMQKRSFCNWYPATKLKLGSKFVKSLLPLSSRLQDMSCKNEVFAQQSCRSFAPYRNYVPAVPELRSGNYLSESTLGNQLQNEALYEASLLGRSSLPELRSGLPKTPFLHELRSNSLASSKSPGNFSLSPYIRAQTLPFLPSLICSFHLRDCLISFLQSSPCKEDIPIPLYCQTPRRYPLRDVHKFLTEFRYTKTTNQPAGCEQPVAQRSCVKRLTNESIIKLTGLPKKVKPFIRSYSETLPIPKLRFGNASPKRSFGIAKLLHQGYKNEVFTTRYPVALQFAKQGFANCSTPFWHKVGVCNAHQNEVLVSAYKAKTLFDPSPSLGLNLCRSETVGAMFRPNRNYVPASLAFNKSSSIQGKLLSFLKKRYRYNVVHKPRHVNLFFQNKIDVLKYRVSVKKKKIGGKDIPLLSTHLLPSIKTFSAYLRKPNIMAKVYNQDNTFTKLKVTTVSVNVESVNRVSVKKAEQSLIYRHSRDTTACNTYRIFNPVYKAEALFKYRPDKKRVSQTSRRLQGLSNLGHDKASLVQFPVTKLDLWSIFVMPKILCRLSPLKYKDRLNLTLNYAKTPFLQDKPCDRKILSGKIDTYQTRLLHLVFGSLPKNIDLNQSAEFNEQRKFHKACPPEETSVARQCCAKTLNKIELYKRKRNSDVFLPSCTTKPFNNPSFFPNPVNRNQNLDGEHFSSYSAHLTELKLMAGLYSNQDRSISQYRKINFRIYSSYSRTSLVKQLEKSEKGVTLFSRSRFSFARGTDPDGLFDVSFSINLPFFTSGSKQNTICLITKKEKKAEWTTLREDLMQKRSFCKARNAGRDIVFGNKDYGQAKTLFNKVTGSVASTAFVFNSLPDSGFYNCILVKQFEITEFFNFNHSFVYSSGPLTKVMPIPKQSLGNALPKRSLGITKLCKNEVFATHPRAVAIPDQRFGNKNRSFVYKAKAFKDTDSLPCVAKTQFLHNEVFAQSASRSQDSAFFKARQVKDPVKPSETPFAPICEGEAFTQTISKWHINGAKEILLYTGGGALESLLKRFNISLFCQFLFGEIQILRKYYKDQIVAEYNKNQIIAEHSLDSFAVNQLDSQGLNQYTSSHRNKIDPISTSYVSEDPRYLMAEQSFLTGYKSSCQNGVEQFAKQGFANCKATRYPVAKTQFWHEVGVCNAQRRYQSPFRQKERHFRLKHVLTDKSTNLFCRRIYRTTRRLKIVQLLMRSKRRPEWMMISVLPVLPPDLRPVLQMGENLIVASDLNTLYQRVIYRNNRHYKGRFLDFHFVSSIHRLVQDAVDRLIENGKGGSTPFLTPGGRPLKSLSDILKGKRGRFRFNLLGKRVDFSGRSVIVVSPNLKIHECGLPREMALELYKYLLIRQLLLQKRVSSIVNAKKVIKERKSFIWDILREIIYYHPLLLNRAPTLHRLGIQAFQPKLALGNAILLHPLVCAGFNADFDGDQMGVHLPLSPQARAEAWDLLWSRNNLLSPATGQPILLPSQDMVLGFYYMTALLPYGTTFQLPSEDGQTKITHKNKIDLPVIHVFSDTFQVVHAYQKKQIDIHTPIWLKWIGQSENGEKSQVPLELRIDVFGYRTQIYPTHKFKSKICKDLNSYSLTFSENKVLNKTLPYRLQNEVFDCLPKRSFGLDAKAKLSKNEVMPKQSFGNATLTKTKFWYPVDLRSDMLNNQDVVSGNEYIRTTVGRVLVNNLISKNN